MQTKIRFILFFILALLVWTLREDIPIAFIEIALLSFTMKAFQVNLGPTIQKSLSFLALCILMYAHYLYFKFSITTEATVSLLIGVTSIRFIQKQQVLLPSDLILSLLIVAGVSLFNSNLTFIVLAVPYFFIMIYLLQKDIFSSLNASNVKNIIKLFFIMSPITILLFIFFPRFQSFLPSAAQNMQGQIGYSGQINNSTMGNLASSSRIVFYAQMENDLNQNELYWRGRSLDRTDGYNWKYSRTNRPSVGLPKFGNDFSYQLKYEQSFDGDLIVLDYPVKINKSNIPHYFDTYSLSFQTYLKKRKAIINATSSLVFKNQPLSQKAIDELIQTPSFIPNKVKNISNKIKANSVAKFIENFEKYIIQNKFSYTLSPGRMPTMNSFLEKKAGFCTHYSALLALLLRYNKIPSRIVTGFQGGIKIDNNLIAIRNQDAHAWVEYYSDNRWVRIDPTSFISPDRVNLSSNFNALGENIAKEDNFLLTSFYKFQNFINTIDYRLSLFLENFDRTFQKELAKKFNLSLGFFYSIGSVVIVLIIIVLLFIFFRKRTDPKNEIDKIMENLFLRLKKYEIDINSTDGLRLIENKIESSQLSHKKNIVKILNYYEKLRFSSHFASKRELERMIKEIRKLI